MPTQTLPIGWRQRASQRSHRAPNPHSVRHQHPRTQGIALDPTELNLNLNVRPVCVSVCLCRAVWWASAGPSAPGNHPWSPPFWARWSWIKAACPWMDSSPTSHSRRGSWTARSRTTSSSVNRSMPKSKNHRPYPACPHPTLSQLPIWLQKLALLRQALVDSFVYVRRRLFVAPSPYCKLDLILFQMCWSIRIELDRSVKYRFGLDVSRC